MRLLLLLLIPFSAYAKDYTFDFSWTYPNPVQEDVGKLDGLKAITTCNLDGVNVPINDAIISDFAVLGTELSGNPGQTLSCSVSAQRISDGLTSAPSVAVGKKLLGSQPSPAGGAVITILP